MAQRIGIDVGGTNVKIALVSDKGKIIYSNSLISFSILIINFNLSLYSLNSVSLHKI